MYYNYIMSREFRNTNYENYLKDKNKILHFHSKEYIVLRDQSSNQDNIYIYNR